MQSVDCFDQSNIRFIDSAGFSIAPENLTPTDCYRFPPSKGDCCDNCNTSPNRGKFFFRISAVADASLRATQASIFSANRYIC